MNQVMNDFLKTLSKQSDVPASEYSNTLNTYASNSETTEATGSGSAGGFVAPISMKEDEKFQGGKADNKKISDLSKKHKVSVDLITKQLKKGINVEMEHTNDRKVAREIAMDHISEDPKYYDKLEKIEEGWSEKYKKSIDCNNPKGFSQKAHCKGRKKTETKEATGSASSGSYVTPAAWAKSTDKKDWRGKSKPQIPGGKFVQVKKKCKKFPYCNQGDIKALNIFENETVKNAIKNVSKQLSISEEVIISILKNNLQ